MVVNLMSWNTALYEFKNKPFKKSGLDNENFLKVYERIKEHLNKHLKKENAVAVLQEIPFKSNFDWKEHPIFTEVKKDFPADQYDLLYNLSTKNQIMMTVVVAKRGIIKNNPNGINTNRFVSFNIKDIRFGCIMLNVLLNLIINLVLMRRNLNNSLKTSKMD